MTEEEKKIEDMEKEIAELKEKKAKLAEEAAVIEVKEPEIPKIEEKKEEFIPPDPIIKAIPEFEGGIYIEWIDNRYHINGIRGIPNGNRIIMRSLKAVDSLIRHLKYARVAFDQKEMIDTKAPK